MQCVNPRPGISTTSAEHLAGRARFAIVWKREADGWKMSRALSFARRAAKEASDATETAIEVKR